MVQDSQAQDVEVILLNMPVTDDYIAFHPNGIRDCDRYLGELTNLGRHRNIRLLDFGREVSSLEFFRDPSHLSPNRSGSIQLLAGRSPS